ncbi:sigma-E factor negative regulatory protein [Pseudomonadota bacterium]
MNIKNEKISAEKLSAYIDDDLSAAEIEQLIAKHESSEQKDFSSAARYQMMGDALRGELSDASMIDVSAQVREALRNESFDAVESAPISKQTKTDFNLVVWLDSFFGPMVRPLAGMAVAASVAVLMVVAVVQTESPGGVQPLASQSESQPVKAANTLLANQQPVLNEHAVIEQQQTTEFDRYLAEHAEFAAQDTLQGRIPYVRAVSYEAE